MPSLSNACLRYSTARVSLPGGLLVSIRSSAWKCWSVSASIAAALFWAWMVKCAGVSRHAAQKITVLIRMTA
jgi:hypothetical protein